MANLSPRYSKKAAKRRPRLVSILCFLILILAMVAFNLAALFSAYGYVQDITIFLLSLLNSHSPIETKGIQSWQAVAPPFIPHERQPAPPLDDIPGKFGDPLPKSRMTYFDRMLGTPVKGFEVYSATQALTTMSVERDSESPVLLMHSDMRYPEYVTLMECYANRHGYRFEICDVSLNYFGLPTQSMHHRKWACLLSLLEKLGQTASPKRWLCMVDHDLFITADYMGMRLEQLLGEVPPEDTVFLRGLLDMNSGFVCLRQGKDGEAEALARAVIHELVTGVQHWSDQQALRKTLLRLFDPDKGRHFRDCVLAESWTDEWWKYCDQLARSILDGAGLEGPLWNHPDRSSPVYFRPEPQRGLHLHGRTAPTFAYHLAGMGDKKNSQFLEGDDLKAYLESVVACSN